MYRYRGSRLRALDRARGLAARSATDLPPLEHLGGLLRRHPPVDVPGLPRFTGGAVGYLGYDVVRTIESLPDAPPDDRDLPDAVMMVTDTLLVLDNLYNRATVIANVEVAPDADDDELRRLYRGGRRRGSTIGSTRLAAPGHDPAARARAARRAAARRLALRRRPIPGRRAPHQGVHRRRRHLSDGALAPARGARRRTRSSTYRYLRALNPAPYLYYLHCDDIHVIGSSPEILVRVEDGEVTLRPIAGTRPRGATPEEDAALAAELAADPKERAEHLMLVDLGRNDVGRVARFGTVRLTAFMTIERYSHVMHLVSEVRGRLRPGLDARGGARRLASRRARCPARPRCAPCRSSTSWSRCGAGPTRARWATSAGARARMDTAITIRTCVMRGGRAWIQAGAGIVADSDPAAEWRETEAKARAVLLALALAARASARD